MKPELKLSIENQIKDTRKKAKSKKLKQSEKNILYQNVIFLKSLLK